MSKFYSKSTGGFYDDGIHESIPTDKVAITDTQWQAALDGQSAGKIIQPDANGIPVAVDPPAPTLAQVQADQIVILTASYSASIQIPVAYMGTTFQADPDSQLLVAKCLAPGAVPAGFYWQDVNDAQVPMTFAQLQGLAGVMLLQGQASFTKLQGYKGQVRAATTVAAVQAITWLT